MKIVLHGERILKKEDFHRSLVNSIESRQYYGCNLDALWDLLSAGVGRPVEIIWWNSNISKVAMGDDFDEIIAVLDRVKVQDEMFGFLEKFTYELI